MSRIRAACDALDKGACAYTIADVGRYCERRWGGPKAQSIRNKPDVLARYIRLRIAEHTLRGSNSEQASPANVHLDLSDALKAQEQYLLALAEIETLRREVSRLRVRLDGYTSEFADELVDLTFSGLSKE